MAALLEQMDQGVIMVDADLSVLAINGPLYALFGESHDLLPGASFVDLVRFLAERGEYGPGDVEAIVARQLDSARRADPAFQEHRRPDGRVLEIRTRRSPSGGFVRTYTDITERKRAENDLAGQRELLRLTLENMGQGIVLLDRDLRFRTYNAKALELLGIPEAVMRATPTLHEVARFQVATGLLDLPLGAPEFGDDVDAKLGYLLERLERPEREFVYARPQGDGRFLEIRIVPLPDGGQVRTYTDITDRLIADEAVRQSREILKGVIDSIPALIDVRDRDRNIQLVNRYHRETYHPAGAPAAGPAEEQAAELDRHVVESGQGVPFFEESGCDGAGRRRDWLTTKMPLTDESGAVSHIVTVALDITARKRAEAELRDVQTSLIQAEKLASLAQMVAGVAHEVNTPIGVTLTAISHLGEEVARIQTLFAENRIRRADFQEFLDVAWETTRMILSNIERAGGLIQSFKQVAVDQASGERRAFDLAAYVDEVLLSLRPRLRRTKVTVETDIAPGLTVDGHPGAFAQVLSNLVINALVHAYDEGEAGRIALSAREEPAGWVTMRYDDDGRGIPDAIRDRVFDPFFTTRRGEGASGLGLSICRNIMTGTMQGSIAMESGPGRGTRFLLRFPLRVTGVSGYPPPHG
ncbi:PAS-domain containing protein [Azospirillum doebereinerae]|uniref:PAS-domain containing protein n=1 Tax=Azospirillum doebereinerae TaxID=92933 RepID=UPI001EE62BDE|nr:PAS-domain containing protein [Azospirillum doebereinerae]MCG5244018.1 PAS-domain containing protein [Azospirillum doebereinerae]